MFILAAMASLVISQVEQPPTADALLQSVLDQRLSLRSGRLTFSVEDAETHIVLRFETAFDGEKRRMDVTYPPGSFRPPDSSEPSDYARIVKYIVTDEEFLHHIVELRPNPEKYVVTKISMDEWREKVRENPRHEHSHAEHKQAFDVRIIGIATQQFGAWWRIGLMDLLQSDPLRTGGVSEETLNDESVWLIDAQYDTGIHKQLWLSPAKGGGIVATRVEFKDRESLISDVMTADVDQFPEGVDGTVWFPSEVRSYRELPDRHSSESVLRVEEAEFNREIPPETFTLAGLDLPIGAHVAVPETEHVPLSEESGAVQRHKKWDGTQLVPLEPSDRPQQQSQLAENTDKASRWVWLVAANLVFVGVFILFAWWRR